MQFKKNVTFYFLMILTSTANAESLDIRLEGDYHNRINCIKNSNKAECDTYLISEDMYIKKMASKKFKILIETKQMMNPPNWQPYYCSLEGYASYKNERINFSVDTNGIKIQGLEIKVGVDSLIVKASDKVAQNYCATSPNMNNLSFSRKNRYVIKNIENIGPVY